MLSPLIKGRIEKELSDRFHRPIRIESVHRLGGGSINEAAHIRTNEGDYFVKWNDEGRYPGMFAAEANGLVTLKDSCPLPVPSVIAGGSGPESSYLILEYLQAGTRVPGFWEHFGASLGKLHLNTRELFGLDYSNYIGSIPQSNASHTHWNDFFAHERLEAQLRLSYDKGLLRGVAKRFDNLFRNLDSIFPQERPALLHGDLWKGNFMTGPEGSAALYDPAIYYGHREMDIAMTKLFGGFDEGFYEGYNQEYSLEKGWEKRVEICNLYPLLVHVNLFGGSYVSQVEQVMRKF